MQECQARSPVPLVPLAAVVMVLAILPSLPAAGEDDPKARFDEALATAKEFVARKDFDKAYEVLGECEDPTSPVLDRVLAERKKVLEAARKCLAGVEAECLDLVRKGRRKEAIEKAEAITSRLPFVLAGDAGKILQRLREEETAEILAPPPKEVPPDVREGVLRSLTALDFAGARKALDEVRASGKAPAAEIESLRKEADRIEEAWTAIRASLELGCKKRNTIEVPASVRPIGGKGKPAATLKGILKGVDGEILQVSPDANAPPAAYRILSLPDDFLLGHLTDGKKASKEDPGAREGLGLLLFHAEGPARAAALLADPASGPKAAEYSKRLAAEEGPWLARKLAVVDARRSTAGKGPAALAVLAEEYRALLLPARKAGTDGVIREAIVEGFLAARSGTIPLGGVFPLLQVQAQPGGEIVLAYDFSKASQAGDFHPVGSVTAAPRASRGKLVLKGEYRILDGNPFLGTLRVRGIATDFPRKSPNVNVALWTAPEDFLTFREGGRISAFQKMQEKEHEVGDFFVFGMGYRTLVETTMGKAVERLMVVETQESMALPAHVLLAGSRGRTLHRSADECLKAWALEGSLPGRFQFSIDWEGKKVRWTVGGKELILGNAFAPWLEAPERSGSATILTNDHPVTFEKIEIAGRLDGKWLEERRRKAAEAEVREVAPELLEETPPASP